MAYDVIIGRDPADKEKFGDKGLIYLGKGYVKMGNYTSLSNKIWLDIARSHVCLVAGKRGCLTGDTLVFTDKGYKPIIEFNENEDKILSFDKDKKEFEWEKAKLLSYPMKNEELLKIELEDGREITLTKEHPLLMNYGKYLFWREGKNLKINDKMVIPLKLPEVKKEKEKNIRLARLLGYILADGNINIQKGMFKDGRGYWYNGTKARIRIFNDDNQVLIDAKKGFEEEFDTYCKRYSRNDCNCDVIQVQNQQIVKNFVELGVPAGNKSSIIRVPKLVFESSNEFKANFINALFCCDGYIPKDAHYIDYSSNSKEFLKDIQVLLTHFEIESTIRKKITKLNGRKFLSYRLFITDNSSVETFKKIGFISKFKQDRLSNHKSNNTRRRKTFYIEDKLVCKKIKNISRIKGVAEVYDLSVPKNHSFIANGIISHNSGKSYTLGTIAEELTTLPSESANNIASIIFDTMGIFWTMKYQNEKDKPLLDEWNLETKSLPVKVFVPYGKEEEYRKKNIPFDKTFALKSSEIEADDWISIFNLKMTSLEGVLISRIISNLKRKSDDFTLLDIQNEVKSDKESNPNTKEIVYGLFDAATSWGIFSKDKEGTKISDLINAGKTTILDVSVYSSIGAFNVRALVISLISRKIFESRMSSRKKEEIESIQHGQEYLTYKSVRQEPLIWLFIDECLTGETEIITDKNHTQMKEIINKIEKGEKVNVLAYDVEKKEFGHYPIKEVYKKGKRKIIEITTETGRKIRCTPEHRVLTRGSFASAFSVNEIAAPLMQHYSDEQESIKARILGHLFGDGWTSEKTRSLGFAGKTNPDDLNKIKNDLKLIGLKSSNIFTRKTNSKIVNAKKEEININGTNNSIQASTKAYKFFELLGIIEGDKIIQKTNIPDWIKNGTDEIKSEFLAALMGSDGQRISKAKKAKGDFNAIRLSFNKLESLEKEALEYANEIKELFESLGIKISRITRRLGNMRKNGDKTIKIVITLEKNLKNTIKFLDKIGYRYCQDKELEGIKWSSYLKARLLLKEERNKVYEKALELKKRGFGKAKISKELGFPEAQIRDWIYNKMKPGIPKTFPDIDEWIKNRMDKNILYDKVFRIKEIGEEEVYDLSVDKVHNFVSNGLITHNCHEFLPKIGKTPATDALVQILREGRQPGISLVLATQQPGQIHKDVMTQADIVIAHRVTAKPDIEALEEIMQSYLLKNIKQELNNLPPSKGSAILLDDNSERIYPIRVRPRFTWHGGEAPSAIKADLEL